MPAGDVTSREASTPVALTGRQKVALMLDKAGYSDAEIAERMNLKHRESASQLLSRARAADRAFKAAIADFIGEV